MYGQNLLRHFTDLVHKAFELGDNVLELGVRRVEWHMLPRIVVQIEKQRGILQFRESEDGSSVEHFCLHIMPEKK